jgi:serine/threonine-protein kinase RsbW
VKHVRRIANRVGELRPLSTWAIGAARELGCPADRCADLDLCLNEVVSNIIRHGYDDDLPHEIGVELTRESGMLVLRIEDDARPFDPLGMRVTQPTTLDEAGPGGRGIPLIREAADSATYERRERGNRLTLRFALGD